MTQKHEHIGGAATEWVLSTLEHDQLVTAKRAPVPRRKLTRGETFLLWALRIYLFFMMAVVFWQAWTAAR